MATVNEVVDRDLVSDVPPSVAKRYRLLRQLSTGASGEVFLVHDLVSGAPRALKLFAAHLATSLVRSEFSRLSSLDHPGVVHVTDAGVVPSGTFAGRAFLVTELVSGPSLADLLAGLAEKERFAAFASAAEALADALAYLHGKGVLHGDISPGNVRCTDGGRPILIDFGLAASTEEVPATVSGTLGFLAPEALLGEAGPAKDLFALGATLYDAWTGAPPFGRGMESIRHLWQGPPAPPSTLAPGLPPAWDRLVLHLLAATPEERPASAREVLRTFRAELPGGVPSVVSALTTPFPAGDPLAGVVVGRSDELARLRGLLAELSEGRSPAHVVSLVGPPGSGRRTLMARALRDARLAQLAQSWGRLEIEETSAAALSSRQGTVQPGLGPGAQEPSRVAEESYAKLAQAIDQRARQRPLCLALAGGKEDEALAKAIAATAPGGKLLVLLPSEAAVDGPGAMALPLRPLSREAIVELASHGAGGTPPAAVVDEIVAVSSGLAGAAALLVRRWIARTRGEAPAVGGLVDGGNADLAHLLDTSFAALGAGARSVVLGIALAPEAGAGFDHAGDVSARLEAERAGWLVASHTRLPSELHLQALWRALTGDPTLQAAARSAAAVLAESDVRRAEVHAALGEQALAAREFVRAMHAATAGMAWSRIAEWGTRAVRADARALTLDDRLLLASALGILGQYDQALALLMPVESAAAGNLAVVERKAWLLGRRGDPGAARALLEQALTDFATHEGVGLLRARLARMMVASGSFADALRVVAPLLQSSTSTESRNAAREAAILALAYMGRTAEARQLVRSFTEDARDTADRASMARAAAMAGLVEQLDGHPVQAADLYGRAVTIDEEVQDLHGLAAARFNLGCTLAEIGDYAGALDALDVAIRELGRLAVQSDQALAVFNVGQLFLQLGDVDAATRAMTELERDAARLRIEALSAYAKLLRAQVERKRGLADAETSYAAAREAFRHAGMQAMAAIAMLEHAETLAEHGKIELARELLRTTEPPPEPGAANDDVGPAAELRLAARARIALCDPAADAGQPSVLAPALAAVARQAKEAGRLPMAWRLAALAARLRTRSADPGAAADADLARACFSEVKMRTPAKYHPGLESDAEARILALPTNPPSPAAGRGERAALLEGHLRRLLRINKRLNSDLRLARVLETIIDTVIELTDAERGFLLLKDGNGELVVKVARNMDQTSLEGPSSSLSRSIAKQAADSGEPVMAVDAAGDRRFAEHLSVSDLHLRSVLAVPLTVKGNVVGTIYVDHRLRKGVFGDDELAMVLDFAEQGAIAIENARVISELRRRDQQVQSLNRRLERELKVQEAALSDVRIELKESRQAAALRYDYGQIVGQSPCMVDLFRLLDRVTDTALPVVIEGESGTGKELVARAIHYNGPRKDRPFVSENCAAIPETLLESALFGHVRGSFTGADRDARGLFSIANGGTLFLDEVAEMSAAMQGKLLRVLQDGHFHRVGAERPEKADVRIVVATNRNLADMVEAGKFRKDLFYRLSVVRLFLPPLRERREDVPLLVRHFLERAAAQAGTPAKSVEAAALAKLSRYHWPGNVRELENEIARAGVFSGSSITVSDLSPQIQTGQDPSETIRNEPDSLRIRHRVERLERQLLREALGRSQGNQTKAAALLGLSRFGLQKKLRRYNLGA